MIGPGILQRSTLLLLTVLALAVGCGGGGGSSSSSSSGGSDLAAAPTTVFRGRSSAVTLTTTTAAYTDGTPVTASDGATVSAVHAVTGTQLALQLAVPLGFTAAALTLTVDGSSTASLAVADALTGTPAPGWSLPQGATHTLDLVNHDAAHPLDAGVLTIDAGQGVDVFVDVVSPDALGITLHALPTAAVGPHDLHVDVLDMVGGTPVASSTLVGAFTVEQRTVVPLAIGKPMSFTIAAGDDGAYLSLTGAQGKLLDLRIVSAMSDGHPLTPFIALLSPDKGLKLPLSQITGDELLAPIDGDVLLYVGPADSSSGKSVDFTVAATLLTPVTAAEAEPNDKLPVANSVALPALLTANLSPDIDVDVFVINVPAAGKLLVRTLAGPKNESADTYLSVTDDAAVVLAENDDEDPGMNDAYSFLRADVVPGKVYVRVKVGTGGFGTGAPYRLVAALR